MSGWTRVLPVFFTAQTKRREIKKNKFVQEMAI